MLQNQDEIEREQRRCDAMRFSESSRDINGCHGHSLSAIRPATAARQRVHDLARDRAARDRAARDRAARDRAARDRAAPQSPTPSIASKMSRNLPAAAYRRDAADLFLKLGLEIAGFRVSNSAKVNNRRFRSHFSTRPEACAEAWHDMKADDPGFRRDAHPRHLFWTLLFATQYPTEHQLAGRVGCSENTARFWVWYIAPRLQNLKAKKIRWSNCDPNDDTIFFLSVDGVHCPIQEPNYFEVAVKFSSHKYGKKAALTYEVGISIRRKKICWLRGPFPAGKGDDDMYREALKAMVPPGKKVIADRKYSCFPDTVSAPNRQDHDDVKEFKRRCMARHESLNRLIKGFKCMSTPWRHSRNKHVIFFEACCVMVQYNLDCGDELFDVLPADE